MGIVGVPNVGKSSFFNALSRCNIPAENFPFCTIEPNEAVVPLPDQRFKWLCQHFHPRSEVPPTITINDIAGLVRGASEGAGLGNEFLSHISAVDGIYHLCRAFENDEVTHVEGDVNPVRDLEIVDDELMIKDMNLLDNAIEGMRKNVERKVGGRERQLEFESLQKALAFMREEGKPVRFGNWTSQDIEVLNRYQLLTAKEVVYLVNLSKRDYMRKGNRWLPKIAEYVKEKGGGIIIPFSVEFEQEWLDADMGGEDALKAFKEEHPNQRSMLPRILKTGYQALHLIHFFTCGADEVRGWTIRRGKTAPEAASVIHSDIGKNFIRAEVYHYNDIKELGNEAEVQSGGRKRTEGKAYVVQDGDICFFRHNS
eukprot:scaffold8229_cov239-Pinguiococcus_pyrenoidosus.AAC.2